MHILTIQTNLLWNRQIVAPVHLRPSGNTRDQFMNSRFSSQYNQVVLIKQRRTWTDKAEIAT